MRRRRGYAQRKLCIVLSKFHRCTPVVVGRRSCEQAATSSEVPQIQSSSDCWTLQLWCSDGYSQCIAVQETVEIPQVQGLVVDDPEIMPRQVPAVSRMQVQTVQKTVEIPQLQGCRRPCDHAATSGSSSDQLIDSV